MDFLNLSKRLYKTFLPRLFSLAVNKFSSVGDDGSWVNDVWLWSVGWRRELFSWESELLSSFLAFIDPVTPSQHVRDSWVWIHHSSGFYSCSSAYDVIHSSQVAMGEFLFRKIWFTLVPSKVSGFVWKLILGKVPTKEVLSYKGILPNDDNLLCCFCNQHLECVDHLFLHCNFASSLWNGIYAWFGIYSVLPSSCKEHLAQHSTLLRSRKFSKIRLVV
ncbi:hypothetical protein RIF29_08549 [Crotalaria pallida]|uniref:Reverse transcriptase zinc-binding domain-containing protein n=1 Tax=Crotalaria pallida TaxID=3830 RepID=A0AAN9FTV2_CROPI